MSIGNNDKNKIIRFYKESKDEKGEENGFEDHQERGGGGSGRMRLDCELRPGFVGGVEGNGRLSRELGILGAAERFWYDWSVS